MLITRTLINQFLFGYGSSYDISRRQFLQSSAQVVAVLTCCRPFLHSSIAPRLLASEIDNRGAHVLPKLRTLLLSTDTAQFSPALTIHDINPAQQGFNELVDLMRVICCSQYGSRSLLRVEVTFCFDYNNIWDLFIMPPRCVNLEEIETDCIDFFQIFSDAAEENNFRIPLKKLVLRMFYDDYSINGFAVVAI